MEIRGQCLSAGETCRSPGSKSSARCAARCRRTCSFKSTRSRSTSCSRCEQDKHPPDVLDAPPLHRISSRGVQRRSDRARVTISHGHVRCNLVGSTPPKEGPMKLLIPRVHGYIDYLLVVALMLAPTLLRFEV